MVQVSDAGTSRGSFIQNDIRFWPYNGGAPRTTLRKAMAIIQKSCLASGGCNSYFSHLPGGRTFKAVWEDPGVWIHWDPRPDPGFYGATSHAFSVADVTISNFALNKGVWATVATLVHELAHVNGAPGGTSTLAEGALKPCGVGGLVDPGVIGRRETAESDSDNRIV
jgi:hypothetical protein